MSRKPIFAVLAVAAFSLNVAFGIGFTKEYIEASTGTVVPGEWNRRFDDAKALADSQHIPMVVFFGGLSCSVCETLQKACITDEFTSWQARKKLIMVFTTDNILGKAMQFAKPTDSDYLAIDGNKGYPYIAVYWNRDGTEPEKHSANYIAFRGRAGSMPVKEGTLAQQLMGSIELVAGAYPYAGGDFLLPDSATTRLEVEEGYAAGRKVVVPLTREPNGIAYTNSLVCGDSTVAVAWTAGATEAYAEVSLPDGVAEGGTVPLTLLGSDGTVRGTSAIGIVKPEGNSVRNPAWIGEDFDYGEWTLDYAAAKAKGGYVLAMFSGVLWCPYCYGMENSLLASDEFKAWAKDSKVSLVLFNQSKASSPATAAGSGLASLLTYDVGTTSLPGFATASGASYLTRKGIGAAAAKQVIDQTTKLTAEWLAPGSTAARLGNPTVLLVKDDKVVARFNSFRDSDKVYAPAENVCRLNELLKLVDGVGEANKYVQTTSLSLTPGGASVSAELQVNQTVQSFKLVSVPSRRVTFSASGAPADNPAILTVVRYANGKSTALARGTNSVSYAFNGDTDCFLQVSSFATAREYGADTELSISVSSTLVIEPAEKTASLSVDGKSVALSVEKGLTYRLKGFGAPDASFLKDLGEAEDGGRFFTALKSGTIPVTPASGTLEWQLWKPGRVAFDAENITVFEFQKSGVVSVSRSGGSSGKVSVKVQVAGGDAEKGVRYSWDDSATLTWADGESGARTIDFAMLDTGRTEPDQEFVLKLAAADGSAASAVADGTLTVLLRDVDTPVLAERAYDISMFATLDAASAFDPQVAYNVSAAKVSFQKVSGKLPSGVKLVFENGSVRLSGAAKKPGTYEYTFRMKQGSSVGPETTFKFTVNDASDVAAGGNALLGKAVKATLPLYVAEDGSKVVKGVLELSLSAKNKITAKYIRMGTSKISFKGVWSTLTNGMATAALAAKGMALALELDADGRISAEVDDPEYDASLTSGSLGLGVGSYAAAFAGSYTAVLPELKSSDPAGWSYVQIKSVASNGKAKWAGVLGNGQSLSGTAIVTLDPDGYAVLPLFRYRTKDYLAAAVYLKPNGPQLEYPRAVKNCEGTVARWAHTAAPESVHDCQVRGSWYRSGMGLGDYFLAQFGDVPATLYAAVADGWTSGSYGALTSSPTAEVTVANNGLSLTEKNSDVKLKFTASTGLISGSMKVFFGSKKVTAKFKGVVLPGWHDCGCEMPNPDDPFMIDKSLPFAAGAAWFQDSVNGVKVKRGFTVAIDGLDE